jgi:hypothetical protein
VEAIFPCNSIPRNRATSQGLFHYDVRRIRITIRMSYICLNFSGIEFQAGTLLTANDLVIYRLQSCEQTLDTKSVKEKQTLGGNIPGENTLKYRRKVPRNKLPWNKISRRKIPHKHMHSLPIWQSYQFYQIVDVCLGCDSVFARALQAFSCKVTNLLLCFGCNITQVGKDYMP